MWLVMLPCCRYISLHICIVSEEGFCHPASQEHKSKMVEIDLCKIFEGR